MVGCALRPQVRSGAEHDEEEDVVEAPKKRKKAEAEAGGAFEGCGG